MRLILVATPKRLEKMLEEACSTFFGGNTKKFALGVAAAAATVTAPAWAGATLIGASALAIGKYGLSKKGIKSGVQDLSEAAEYLLSSEKQPTELKEKLDLIAEHLKLDVPIVYVPLEEVHHLQFDIGEAPTNGSFYVSHPFLENVFIRPAEFNKTLAKEKEAAFIRLAAALGAKSIHLNSVTIQQTNQIFGQKIKPHLLAPQIGIKATFNEKGELVKDVYKQYHKPKKQPFVPPELEKWVKLDPALRQLATDRMDLNLASVKVSLQFKDTKTTGSEIALALAGRKFDIGGKIEKIQESTWQFYVEFFDKDEIIVA